MSNKARRRFKDKVRELTRSNNPLSMYQAIEKLNVYLRGWALVSEFRSIVCFSGILMAGYVAVSDHEVGNEKKGNLEQNPAGLKVISSTSSSNY